MTVFKRVLDSSYRRNDKHTAQPKGISVYHPDERRIFLKRAFNGL